MHRTLTCRSALVLAATTSLACAQWTQKAPTTSPTARVGAAMDFVPANLGAVLFGGSAGIALSNQTWVYDGLDWTLQAPATSPSGRFGAKLVYDAARARAVLYGGLATNISVPPPNNDTWEWDGTNWTLMSPTTNAGNRYNYGMCYDTVRSRIVMYGGASTQLLTPPNNQTWEYQGTTWNLVTTTGNPGPRERPAMCFHQGLGKAVMFGGGNGSGVLDQTWLYDGVAGTWTQLTIAGSKPSARNAATMVYDADRNLCVLTGGQDTTGVLSDTWTFDGTKWTQQPTTTQTVRDHASTYMPNTREVVKFGGFVAAPNTQSNQTWEIGGGIFGSGCVGTNGVPSLVAANAPLLGQPWSVGLTNLNPTFNIAILAFGFVQLPGIDLSFLNMPGCAAFTFADITLTITGSAGAANWTWPSVAGSLGDAFYGQAFCVDPAANLFGFTVSNPIWATIGF